MGWILEHWSLIAGTLVPALLALLGAVAELTPWAWDNQAVRIARRIWALIPVGETDPKKMGRGKKDR